MDPQQPAVFHRGVRGHIRRARLRIPVVERAVYSIGFLLATTGMLALRQGDIETGISRYQSAMTLFKRQGNRPSEASAAAFLALEVARAGIEKSDAFIKQAEELTKDLRYAPEAKVVIERAKRWNAAVRHRQAPSDAPSLNSQEKKA